MAEFGAHITGTVEGDSPSIFEVLAQENLIASLRPALKYAFKVIAQNYPAKFGWLFSLGDEIYTLMDLVLEHYYLKHYSASFAENFYGMKRVPVVHGKPLSGATRLPSSQLAKSLAFLVLVPYIKHKCDQWFESLRDAEERGLQSRNSANYRQFCSAFLGVYPYLHSLWQGLHFVCSLAFIFGRLKYHSPLLRLAGVVLQNLTQQDIDKHQQNQGRMFDLSGKTFSQSILSLLTGGLRLSAVVLSHSLSLAVFFLQFLEWWYSSDQRTTSLVALPAPPPPQKEKREDLPKMNTICPLCQKMRTNDTALAVSGYVFCYPCVYRYVKDNQCCPVTKLPAETQHLVRLYQPDV